jgi:hypothetical protein
MVGPTPATSGVAGEDKVSAALSAKLAAGTDRRTAVAEVAVELSVPKRLVYDLALRQK